MKIKLVTLDNYKLEKQLNELEASRIISIIPSEDEGRFEKYFTVIYEISEEKDNIIMESKKELVVGLQLAWNKRRRLRAEGNKLCVEGDKLCVEGNRLRADGDCLWTEAILETYGNITLERKNWSSEKQDYEYHLETGEVFKP